MKYHVFDEREQFSEFSGGAISRWAANMLRNDEDTFIVCTSADDTWGFGADRVRLVPKVSRYQKLRARRHYPVWLNGLILRSLYRPDFPALKAGDLVWVHGSPDIAMALVPWAKKAKAKIVLHMHGQQFDTNPASTLRQVSDAVDKLVFCSSFLEKQARKRFPSLARTTILYNGADDSLFYPPNNTGRVERTIPLVLVACRLTPEKGVHVLLESMRLLQERGVAIEGRVLGSAFFGGTPPSEYVKKLHSMAPSNVTLAGYYAGKELAEQFRQADIFSLPAVYNDPFPLAIIEAMASGLPLVTTKRGGIPEALAEGGGILVDADSVEQLADALQKLASDPDARKQIGRDGYASFKKNFTWKSVYADYREIVDSL